MKTDQQQRFSTILNFSTRYAVLVSAVALSLTPGRMLANSGDKVIWREDFRAYEIGPGPALYHDGKGEILAEDGAPFYRFPGGFMGGFDYFGARHWRDFEMRFRLRPLGNFTLWAVVKSGGWRAEINYMWYYVQLTNRQLRPYPHGIPADFEAPEIPTVAIDPPLEAGVWYEVTIRCEAGNRLRVEVAREGQSLVVWDHEVLPGGGGANLHGSAGFDIAKIEVVEF